MAITVPNLSIQELATIHKNTNTPPIPETHQESLFRLYSYGCSHWHGPTGTILVYTSDKGNCNDKVGLIDTQLNSALHLSLAFTRDKPATRLINRPAQNYMASLPRRPFDWELAGRWLTTLFGSIPTSEKAFMPGPTWQLWREGDGRNGETVHFYLFTDDKWQPEKLGQPAIDELLRAHQMRSLLVSPHVTSFS
jgi:hypothetical protein